MGLFDHLGDPRRCEGVKVSSQRTRTDWLLVGACITSMARLVVPVSATKMPLMSIPSEETGVELVFVA